MPNYDDNYCKDYDANIKLELEHLKELKEIQVLIDKLNFKDSLTANKFVQYDKSKTIYEMISDKEIIKAIHPDNQKNQEKEIETPLL